MMCDVCFLSCKGIVFSRNVRACRVRLLAWLLHEKQCETPCFYAGCRFFQHLCPVYSE